MAVNRRRRPHRPRLAELLEDGERTKPLALADAVGSRRVSSGGNRLAPIADAEVEHGAVLRRLRLVFELQSWPESSSWSHT
jgi:hypothetical protein